MTPFNDQELINNPRMGAKQIHPPIKGTTGKDPIEAVNVDVRPWADSQFVISNTESKNSLHYDILVFNNYAEGLSFNVFSNDVLPNDSDEVILTRHARVIINISRIGESTSFQVDGLAGR